MGTIVCYTANTMTDQNLEEKKRLLQKIKEAYENIDPDAAREFAKTLPEFSITEMKPGDVVAIHYPIKRLNLQSPISNP